MTTRASLERPPKPSSTNCPEPCPPFPSRPSPPAHQAGPGPRLAPLLRERHAGERAVVTDAFLPQRRAGARWKAWPPPAGKPWSSMMWSPIRRRRREPPRSARDFGARLVIGFGARPWTCGQAGGRVPWRATAGAISGINQIQGGRLPLVQVPTTAGTGSEVTPISIVTTGETTKSGVVAPQLYADAAYLVRKQSACRPPPPPPEWTRWCMPLRPTPASA